MDEQKQIPVAVIVAAVVGIVGAVVFIVLQLMRPPAGGAAEAAAIAKQIKASPDTPTVPREMIESQVMMRGAGKHTGK